MSGGRGSDQGVGSALTLEQRVLAMLKSSRGAAELETMVGQQKLCSFLDNLQLMHEQAKREGLGELVLFQPVTNQTPAISIFTVTVLTEKGWENTSEVTMVPALILNTSHSYSDGSLQKQECKSVYALKK